MSSAPLLPRLPFSLPLNPWRLVVCGSPLRNSKDVCVRIFAFTVICKDTSKVIIPLSRIPNSDSGAAGNFIDQDIATRLHIPLRRIKSPLIVKGLDGKPSGSGQVLAATPVLHVITGLLHSESLSLLAIPTPENPIVLGFPWLSTHNPAISWYNGELEKWGLYCFTHCDSTVSDHFC
ncbi:hypothetical protein MHYP_G00117510 [Metynnis hypsauchen]